METRMNIYINITTLAEAAGEGGGTCSNPSPTTAPQPFQGRIKASKWAYHI